MTGDVPAVIGGNLFGRVGHKCHLCGLHFANQRNEFLAGIALNIKLCGKHSRKLAHIALANVALIGARMDSDAAGAVTFNIERRLYDIGVVAATRVAKRGYLVDINT